MAIARFQIRSIKLSCDLDKISYLSFTSIDKIFSKISPYNLRVSRFPLPPSSIRIGDKLSEHLSNSTESDVQHLIQSLLDKKSDSPFLTSIRSIISQFNSVPSDSVVVMNAILDIPSRGVKHSLTLTFPYTKQQVTP